MPVPKPEPYNRTDADIEQEIAEYAVWYNAESAKFQRRITTPDEQATMAWKSHKLNIQWQKEFDAEWETP